ncbi:MAG: hypothetical protein CL878_05660 [Dehalococcoidia bacterium]|nr:hypothetical protein [Dehalococcoidia bacterium]
MQDRHCVADIQVVPQGPDRATTYALIDRAIDVIEGSGLHYEVGAMSTTFEGDPAQVWEVLRQVHQAALSAGAPSQLTTIRLIESADGPTMNEKTGKFR